MEQIVSPLTSVVSGSPSIVTVACQLGQRVVSVGFNHSLGVEVFQATLDPTQQSAVVTFQATDPDGGTGRAFAYCIPLGAEQE